MLDKPEFIVDPLLEHCTIQVGPTNRTFHFVWFKLNPLKVHFACFKLDSAKDNFESVQIVFIIAP